MLKDSPIQKLEDLKGRTVGVWFLGNEYPFRSFMSKLKIKTDGSPGGGPHRSLSGRDGRGEFGEGEAQVVLARAAHLPASAAGRKGRTQSSGASAPLKGLLTK